MNRSDWIALCAAVGTFLGLIPSFSQFLQGRKKGKNQEAFAGQTEVQPSPLPQVSSQASDSTLVGNPTPPAEVKKVEPMPPFMRIMGLTATACVVMVIELVVFSWVAHFFKVDINPSSMPTHWAIAYYLLFFIPGALLLLAFLVFSSLFSD